jgi:hypothetical protein
MNGAIWVANGKEHIETAIRSSNSYKLLNPSLKTALFTDSEVTYPEFDFQFSIPDGTLRPKIDMLANTPFEKTIYFDNDTRPFHKTAIQAAHAKGINVHIFEEGYLKTSA